MKYQVYSDKEFVRLLKNNGFYALRQKGDHVVYSDGARNLVMNKKINPMVARRLIKEYNLGED